MNHKPPIIEMTFDDYEVGVKNVIEAKGHDLKDFRVTRRETLKGTDGEYEIDVVARFSILDGAEVVVLIECKHHKNSIKRELVQILHNSRVSTRRYRVCQRPQNLACSIY